MCLFSLVKLSKLGYRYTSMWWKYAISFFSLHLNAKENKKWYTCGPTLFWSIPQHLFHSPLINMNNRLVLFSLREKKKKGGKNQFNSGFSTSSYHFPSQLAGVEFQLTGRSSSKALLPVFLPVMPHNCRGTCIFQPMTQLTKIDTLSYLIKEPKPVTPVQVPNNMRVSEIVFRSKTGRAYYSIEPSCEGRGKEKREKSNSTCKPVRFKTSLFREEFTAVFPACHPSKKLSSEGTSGIFMHLPHVVFSESRYIGRFISLLVFKSNLNSWAKFFISALRITYQSTTKKKN